MDKWWASRVPCDYMQLKEKKGEYCMLEPLNVNQHASGLYKAFQFDESGEDWTYLPFGPFDGFESFRVWLSDVSAQKLFYVIQDKASPQSLGLASFHDIDCEHGVIEVGSVHLSEPLQKTRAATEAMCLMMNDVFEEWGFRRYQWRCNNLNESSKRAALRLGFEFEGIFRYAKVYKGFNRDTAWFSVLNHEWPRLKERFQRWLAPDNFDLHGFQKRAL